MSDCRITKAVIPAAGWGTRLLPATKVVPKELLPIAGRPVIQYAVEEAVASGIKTVILIIGPGKEAIPQYFSRDTALEETLARRGSANEAAQIRRLAELVTIKTVWQEVPTGLASAISLAETAVADEPFVVMLPDALIDAEIPCARQLMHSYETNPGCIVATQTVKEDEVDRFGIVETEAMDSSDSQPSRITHLIERPSPEMTRSRTGVFGRYVLVPEIFDCISRLKPGRCGEFQLTDALSLYAESRPAYACHFVGEHFDVGSKLGFVQAAIRYSLRDPELTAAMVDYFSCLDLTALAR